MLLSPYRALDLTDDKGFLCGKLLADLGADVILIEPPGGHPCRRLGPFYNDIPHPQNSLFWWAFNTSKRSLSLDLESASGRETFKKLAKTADFVLESFPPGHLERLGLGYPVLKEINPGLILTSISPFGQTGPYRDYRAGDLVAMAMGGYMYIVGDPDRPPLRLSVPQAYLHAAAHAAVGSLLALHYRKRTGRGQWVDVSAQEAAAQILGPEPAFWEYRREIIRRRGPYRLRGLLPYREVWPCQDGHVGFRIMGGGQGRGIAPLIKWMAELGEAGELEKVDLAAVNLYRSAPEGKDRWEAIIGEFFLKHTKAELYREALKRRFYFMPGYTPAELAHEEQLLARQFWAEVSHPELKRSYIYPGAPFKSDPNFWATRRAPPVGEDSQEILAELDSGRAPHPTPPRLWSVGATHKAAALRQAQDTALDGVKVADFTWVWVGPLITKCLADFGAQVVKVETSASPDLGRIAVPFREGQTGLNQSGAFVVNNSSKYSLGLNLGKPGGLEVARRLVAWADVVVENHAPGRMAAWGLSYPDLQKIKPDIIMLSTSLQGQTGPNARHPGFGWNASALSGINHFAGWPDREPVGPYVAYTDYVAPMYALVAILGALDYRQRTGKGLYIDQSQYEATLSFLSIPLLDYIVNGREWNRRGNRSGRAAPHGAYPCRGEERWCAIEIYTDQEWQALCRVAGQPAWSQDARLATLAGRQENEDELDKLVAAWTIEHTAEEVMAWLQGAGVAAGVVQNSRDLLERDPQLRHRRYHQVLDHPEIGPCIHYGWPTKLSASPYQLRPAPCLGEHTEYVCRELLGMSEEEFRQLKASGALE